MSELKNAWTQLEKEMLELKNHIEGAFDAIDSVVTTMSGIRQIIDEQEEE